MENRRYTSALIIAGILFSVFSTKLVIASDLDADNSLNSWYVFTPYDDYSYCSNWGNREWQVSFEGNNIAARELQRKRKQQTFPFPFEMGKASEGLAGDVAIHKVFNGYLVGFNAGEFGGGIWWFSNEGEKRKHLLEDNLLSFHEVDIGIIGFAGLSHLTRSEGHVLLFRNNNGNWGVEKLFSLDAAPMASYRDKSGSVYLVTTDSVWIIDNTGSSTIIHKQDSGWVYPNSIIVTEEGVLYIGIRDAVVRLTPASEKYIEEWMIPTKCKMVVKDRARAICNCVGFD